MMRKENWFGNAEIEMEVCQMNVQYKNRWSGTAKTFTTVSCPSPIISAEERLAEAVGKLSLVFCKETYVGSRSSSTLLVYFSGILGFLALGLKFEWL